MTVVADNDGNIAGETRGRQYLTTSMGSTVFGVGPVANTTVRLNIFGQLVGGLLVAEGWGLDIDFRPGTRPGESLNCGIAYATGF